jgi:hypothetical protein
VGRTPRLIPTDGLFPHHHKSRPGKVCGGLASGTGPNLGTRRARRACARSGPVQPFLLAEWKGLRDPLGILLRYREDLVEIPVIVAGRSECHADPLLFAGSSFRPGTSFSGMRPLGPDTVPRFANEPGAPATAFLQWIVAELGFIPDNRSGAPTDRVVALIQGSGPALRPFK